VTRNKWCKFANNEVDKTLIQIYRYIRKIVSEKYLNNLNSLFSNIILNAIYNEILIELNIWHIKSSKTTCSIRRNANFYHEI
jgi:hypothetical protein